MGNSAYLIGGIGFVLIAAHYLVIRASARDRALRWLGENHYRVRSFRSAWLRTMTPSSFYRNSDRAFDFIAEVDDRDLGGAGKVRLRVWMDWLGKINDDVESQWIDMPSGGVETAKPLMDRLADAQLDILRRVQAGQTRLEMNEHVEALKHRGMLTSDGILEVTDAGREWLASQHK